MSSTALDNPAAPAPPPPPPPSVPPKKDFDPEDYKMTIGEHLEELRWRLILALIGLVVAVVICLAFGEQVLIIFCKPYITAARAADITPQFVYTQISEVFMYYLKIALISSACLASPWMLYQIWLFVAAGLYPHERKALTRFIPLSIILLIIGMVFVYVVVLPLTIRWLLAFSSEIPLPFDERTPTTQVSPDQVFQIPQLHGDPARPTPNMMWLNDIDGRLKFNYKGKVRVIPFGPERLFAPMISVGDYIDLVMVTLITFGLAFQLPLVMLALARIGITDVAFYRKHRRVIYFVLTVFSAVMAPGDVVSAMMSLLVPMILLYEFGILLVIWTTPKEDGDDTTPPAPAA